MLTLPLFSQWEYVRNDNPAFLANDTLSGDIVIDKETIFVNGYFSKNDGNGWNFWKFNSTMELDFLRKLLVNDKEVFAVYDSLIYTSDFGGTWEYRSNGLYDIFKGGIGYVIGIVKMVNTGNLFIADRYFGVFMSSTNGVSWVDINNVSTRNGRLRTIAVMNNYLFVSGSSKIFRTTDNGVTWDSIPKSMINKFLPDGNDLWAGGTSGLFLSKDLGKTWSTLFTQDKVECILKKKSTIIIGTFDSGIFYSNDNGESWKEYNEGLICKRISSIGWNSKYVFIITNNSNYWPCGLYRTPISNFGISDVEDINHTEVTISPNPTADYIDITGSIDGFKILDLMGVCILDSKEYSSESIRINLSELLPGIYFIKFGNTVKKIIKI